jgi:hypothetical protein
MRITLLPLHPVRASCTIIKLYKFQYYYQNHSNQLKYRLIITLALSVQTLMQYRINEWIWPFG